MQHENIERILIYRCATSTEDGFPTLAAGEVIGWIDTRGMVYAGEPGQAAEPVGRIDYLEGDIYNAREELIGWIEDEGAIIAVCNEEDEQVGFVSEDGEVFGYDSDGEEVCLGIIPDLDDAVQGAAALLLLLGV